MFKKSLCVFLFLSLMLTVGVSVAAQEDYSPFTVEIKDRAVGSNTAFFTLSVRANETLYFFDFNLNCGRGVIVQRIFPLKEKTIEGLITKGLLTVAGTILKPLGIGMSVYELFNEYFEVRGTAPVTTFSIKNPLPGETAEFLFWLSPTQNWQEWKVELTTKWQKNPNETISSNVEEIVISDLHKWAVTPGGLAATGLQYFGRNPQGYEEYRNLKDNSILVKVPAGEFLMGSNNGDSNEKPVHEVYLDAYYIDKYEVTNRQYREFVEATGHRAPEHWGKDDHPVGYINWVDAVAYATWADKRLPTEAEWEKAARGGLVGKKYPWGDSIDPAKANYGMNVGHNTPVGTYPPNSYGLYDMAGNIWEWVSDRYDKNYYSNSSSDRNPQGPNIGIFRIRRGGGRYSNTGDLRCAYRNADSPTRVNFSMGFRCAKSP